MAAFATKTGETRATAIRMIRVDRADATVAETLSHEESYSTQCPAVTRRIVDTKATARKSTPGRDGRGRKWKNGWRYDVLR